MNEQRRQESLQERDEVYPLVALKNIVVFPHNRHALTIGREKMVRAIEEAQRHVFEAPEDILLVCAGGRAGAWSACLPGWGKKWTRSVTIRVEGSTR